MFVVVVSERALYVCGCCFREGSLCLWLLFQRGLSMFVVVVSERALCLWLLFQRGLSMFVVVVSERALYVFECGFHPLFSLTQGNCRLGYKQAENRYGPLIVYIYPRHGMFLHITFKCSSFLSKLPKYLPGLNPRVTEHLSDIPVLIIIKYSNLTNIISVKNMVMWLSYDLYVVGICCFAVHFLTMLVVFNVVCFEID